MKLWKTTLLAVVIIAATTGVITFMFATAPQKPESAASEPVWDVRTVLVTPSSHRPQIRLIGQIEPEQDLYDVAQLTASVVQVYHRAGEHVEQGELIIELDDFNAQTQLQQVKADLSELESQIIRQTTQQQLDIAALKVEQQNLELLTRRLKNQKSITNTQQAIEDLELQIKRQAYTVLQHEITIKNHPAATQQLNAQKQKLELARDIAIREVAHTKIRAPFSGTLAEVLVKQGAQVNLGQSLYRLYSNSQMNLVVQIPTRLLLEKDQLSGLAHAQNRQSKVIFSHNEATIKADQGGFKTWFKLIEPEPWLPGDIAYLTLDLSAEPDTLQLPAAAVFQDNWIYTVDENQRLTANEITVLGSANIEGQTLLIVRPLIPIKAPLRVLITRLNNPTTGMKIYEQGVDPEPTTETNQGEETKTEQEIQNEDA